MAASTSTPTLVIPPHINQPMFTDEVSGVVLSLGLIIKETGPKKFNLKEELQKNVLMIFGCYKEYMLRMPEEPTDRCPLEWSWLNKVKPKHHGTDESRKPNLYVLKEELDPGIWENWLESKAVVEELHKRGRAIWKCGMPYPVLRDIWLSTAPVYFEGEWHQVIGNNNPTKRHIEVTDNELRWRGNGGRCPTGLAVNTTKNNDEESGSKAKEDEGVQEVTIQLSSSIAVVTRNKAGDWKYQGDAVNPAALPPNVHKAAEDQAEG